MAQTPAIDTHDIIDRYFSYIRELRNGQDEAVDKLIELRDLRTGINSGSAITLGNHKEGARTVPAPSLILETAWIFCAARPTAF